MTRDRATLLRNLTREHRRACDGIDKGCDGLTPAECKEAADHIAHALSVLRRASYREEWIVRKVSP